MCTSLFTFLCVSLAHVYEFVHISVCASAHIVATCSNHACDVRLIPRKLFLFDILIWIDGQAVA